MAQPIAAVVVASSTRNSAALINYALNDKKNQKGERYVIATGVHGLFVRHAEAQFRDVRKKHGKNRAGQYVQGYHVIQAFAKDGIGALDPGDPDYWERAHALGRALAELKAPGRQALVVTQRDGKTGCLHNHIVINSVERATGRSYDSSWVTHSRLVQEHDQLLADQGYIQRDDLRQAASDSKDRFERGEVAVVRGLAEHESRELREYAKWLEWDSQRAVAADLGEEFSATEPFSQDVLAGRVQDALAEDGVNDWDSFVEAGRRRGVKVTRRGKNGRGIRYGMARSKGTETVEPASRETRRDETLGAQFTLDALEALWAPNAAEQQDQVTATVTPSPAPTNVPKKQQQRTTVRPTQQVPAGPSLMDRFEAEMADVEAEMEVMRKASREAFLKSRQDVPTAPDASALGTETTPPSASAPDVEEHQEATEGVGNTSYASAPDLHSAVRSAPDVEGFRSLLRDVRVRDQKRQDLIDQVAAFDEHAVALLERGEMFAEASVPKGIGRRFLTDYEDQIDPEVFYFLDRRETKKEAATRLWDRSTKMPPGVRDELRAKARRLRQEVAMGNYEPEVPQGSQRAAQRVRERTQPERDNGPSLA